MSFDTHRSRSQRTRTLLLAREAYCPPGLLGLASSRYALFCALIACLGSLTYGYDQGLLSVVLVEPQFLSRFYRIDQKTHPDSDGASASFWIGLPTASLVLGALVGSLNQGWIADVYSRKYSIVIAVAIFIIGSSIQTAAVSYDMLVVARFVGGTGVGMFSMVTPLYISEISPAEVRGSLLVCEEVSIVVGVVIAFWTTYGTYHMDNEWAWRLPFLLQMVPAIMVGIGICFLPFSPRWLVSIGRDQEALMTLSKLRQLPTIDQRVQLEWLEIRAEVILHKELNAERHPHLQDGSRKSKIKLELASWGDLFRKGCIKRTHIGIMLFFFQQFVGINALIYYSPTLLKSMSLDFNTTLIMAGILNTIKPDRCRQYSLHNGGLITPPLVQKTGYGTYVFFANFCVIGGVWIYFCVPETKGKSLEEMDEIFGDNSPIAEQERRERIERELFTSNEIGPQPKM
ncbi:uncharacterized protein RHO25_002405 [Cercospora beticola]|uniref:Major facilitator superfamily (MFS) profile domain-containing protein n=1 Tax=Cercospora beticola TaxID=122368 RepID=A0ABZ0NE60_CERBT|nr:hypothetical protein RHO25_002405 [Cercospora beticola]